MANPATKVAEGEQEMSMEDILQSIRQIIAEDEKPTAEGAVAQPASQQEEVFAYGSEVLELTELVEEVPPDNFSDSSSVDIMQEIDSVVSSAENSNVAPDVFSAPSSEIPQAIHASADSLLSNSVANASAASLKRIIETHKANTPMPHFRSGSTVEDLVLETLKPMLKQWLDANLPGLVERIVEREIRKLVD